MATFEPGLDEIVTEVTVALTDTQIEWLRAELVTVGAAELGRSATGSIMLTLAGALPPEPMRLTIELPAGTEARHFDHLRYSAGASKTLQHAEAEALTAVAAALAARERD